MSVLSFPSPLGPSILPITKQKLMKVDVSISQILEYAQQHWFKLILLGLFLYLFTQKDFSFSINLSDPDEMEAPAKEHGQKAALKKEFSPRKKQDLL